MQRGWASVALSMTYLRRGTKVRRGTMMATQKLPSEEREMPSGNPGRASINVSIWPT